jgi:hypothetical protein
MSETVTSGVTLAIASLLLLPAVLPYMKKQRAQYKDLKED